MCLGGGGDSKSTSEGRAISSVSFNPTISVDANTTEPGADTPSTFAATLLAAKPVMVALPDQPKTEENSNTTTLLIYVAVALAARKVLHGYRSR